MAHTDLRPDLVMGSRLAGSSVVGVADEIFANPRLAAIYDVVDSDRSDLDHYEAMVAEFDARRVLDVGCGTGSLACRLASAGIDVVGVDPAAASLDVARSKPDAGAVLWVLGDATLLPPLSTDLATMTGNVGQVFLGDEEFMATLSGIHNALQPGGRLVFEVRDPSRRAWEQWTRDNTRRRIDIPGVGVVEVWEQVIDVTPPLVTFESMYCFEADGALVRSTSTLRFRSRDEVETCLVESGFTVLEVRDAPDRPGLEFVFVAQRPT